MKLAFKSERMAMCIVGVFWHFRPALGQWALGVHLAQCIFYVELTKKELK